jgi:hypothetical protein
VAITFEEPFEYIVLWKENSNQDCQPFHQYQQNEQPPLTSNLNHDSKDKLSEEKTQCYTVLTDILVLKTGPWFLRYWHASPVGFSAKLWHTSRILVGQNNPTE